MVLNRFPILPGILLLYLFIPNLNPVQGQWIDIDLSQISAENVKLQVVPLSEPLVLEMGFAPLIPMNSNPNERIRVGFHLSRGWSGEKDPAHLSEQQGFLPIWIGSLVVTDNLTFFGKLNGFVTSGAVNHLMSYGAVYETQSNWQVTSGIAYLRGNDQLRLRAVDISFRWFPEVFGLPVILGLGRNQYTTKVSVSADTTFGAYWRDHLNYGFVGTYLSLAQWELTTSVTLHPVVGQWTVALVRRFH